MAEIPERDELRRELSGFADREKQIVGALFALMIAHPERVREREWISEQFVRLAGVHFDGEATRGGGVSLPPELEAYTREHSAPVLNACYGLFVRVDPRTNPGLSYPLALAQPLDGSVAPCWGKLQESDHIGIRLEHSIEDFFVARVGTQDIRRDDLDVG